MRRFGNFTVKAYMAVAKINMAMAQANKAITKYSKDMLDMMKLEDTYLSKIPTNNSILFYERY